MKIITIKLLIFCFILPLVNACGGGSDDNLLPIDDALNDQISVIVGSEVPTVSAENTYSVTVYQDVEYADGLSHTYSSTTSTAKPQLLDIYVPDIEADNRPVFMFIHGGGFTGGTKTKPEIVDMGYYYASRGWVFISVDYRTTEELGTISGMSKQQVLTFYKGIAPTEWIEHALQGAETVKQLQQSIAMYTAQRDAKAALRWVVANAESYKTNTDFITVGGASAGAITTIALGISNQQDFRDEITVTDDPTLASTNLEQTYSVKSMVYFWGSNIKLEVFESVYGLNRYDVDDPELFMAHGDEYDPVTPFSEATELQNIYQGLDVYSKLVVLEGEGHGAWHAEVDEKGLFELSYDFIVERQNLLLE